MGFDVTIKRRDGRPLGSIAEVQQVLATVFPGITFSKSPDGPEKLRRASQQGVTFPEILRQHIAASISQFEAGYDASEFSAEFNLGSSETVQEIDVRLVGKMDPAQALFATLDRYGWIATHP
jgi:hypothetical protein